MSLNKSMCPRQTKPSLSVNSKEHTQFRGGIGSLGWFVDHCCPQLSFQLAELPLKTGVTDSSRFAETQQSDPRSEGD